MNKESIWRLALMALRLLAPAALGALGAALLLVYPEGHVAFCGGR